MIYELSLVQSNHINVSSRGNLDYNDEYDAAESESECNPEVESKSNDNAHSSQVSLFEK